jgi:hypothetical protein
MIQGQQVMSDPEARARMRIDRLLEQAGCVVQDRHELNLFDNTGVAIREV